MAESEAEKWFVLKAGRRERAAATALAQTGIEVFLPMQRTMVQRNGKMHIEERPLISSMLFARSTHQRIDALVKRHDYLHFAFRRKGAGYTILEVPDDQMETFRQTALQMADDLTYYAPDTIALNSGMRVRIVGGLLDGKEGIVMNTKEVGRAEFVINFPLLGALATHVEPEYIQVLRD